MLIYSLKHTNTFIFFHSLIEGEIKLSAWPHQDFTILASRNLKGVSVVPEGRQLCPTLGTSPRRAAREVQVRVPIEI
jgi:hypothetical protein